MGVRHYTLQLTTVGPVHIGNGKTLDKKDYFKKDSRIAIINAKEFVGNLNSQQLEDYLKFLNGTDSSQSLQDFLDKHRDLQGIANRSIAYMIDEELTRTRRGSYSYYEVAEFVKDVYGKPYVPGSSIKGMLRTAILAFVLDTDPERYARKYDTRRAQSENRRDRMRACENIERAVFKQETPDPQKHPEAINDIMRYISVSDAAPFSADDLVFAKKYDKFSRLDSGHHKKDLGKVSDADYWEGNELNIYRECLKPGTRFECSISIDERIDQYLKNLAGLDADGLRCVLQCAAEIYSERFLSHFELIGSEAPDAEDTVSGDGKCHYIYESGPFEGKRCRNNAVAGTGFCNIHKDKAPDVASTLGNKASSKPITCYLGGGVGFSNKTVLHALFPDKDTRVMHTANTLHAQFPTKIDSNRHQGLWHDVRHAGFEPEFMRARYKRDGRLQKAKEDRRHWMDPKLGVSPHTVKLAIVGKKKYLMGACEIEIKE